MENNYNESSIKMEKIANLLASPFIIQQFADWKKQRELLRVNFKKLWEDYGSIFQGFWKDDSPEEIKLGLVLTGLEDLGSEGVNESMLSLIGVACPELAEVENLVSKDKSKLIILMENFSLEKENDSEDVFAQFSNEFQLFSKYQKATTSDSLKPKNSALEALQLARSCFLLQFCCAILLIFSNDDFLE